MFFGLEVEQISSEADKEILLGKLIWKINNQWTGIDEI